MGAEEVLLIAICLMIVLQLVIIALFVAKKNPTKPHFREEVVKDKVVLSCNKCGVKLRVCYDENVYICPVCDNKFHVERRKKKKK